MLHRLCGPLSIPLSFSLAAVVPRRCTYRVSWGTDSTEVPPTSSAQRLQRGLPGYLILFATHAFVPQGQFHAREPPSPLVFFLISTHSTATPGIPLSPHELKSASIQCTSAVELRDFTPDWADPLRTLYAQ